MNVKRSERKRWWFCPLFITNQPTNQQTARRRILLQTITFPQLVTFSTIYETSQFITVFTTARHRSSLWLTLIQSTPSHLIPLKPFLILSSYLSLSLQRDLFNSRLSHWNVVSISLPLHSCPHHFPIWQVLPTLPETQFLHLSITGKAEFLHGVAQKLHDTLIVKFSIQCIFVY
jgi:hypothetical protein